MHIIIILLERKLKKGKRVWGLLGLKWQYRQKSNIIWPQICFKFDVQGNQGNVVELLKYFQRKNMVFKYIWDLMRLIGCKCTAVMNMHLYENNLSHYAVYLTLPRLKHVKVFWKWKLKNNTKQNNIY